ncbi:MAG: hypothetical protein AAF529_20175, partial [Pseudomonadota bacterium]
MRQQIQEQQARMRAMQERQDAMRRLPDLIAGGPDPLSIGIDGNDQVLPLPPEMQAARDVQRGNALDMERTLATAAPDQYLLLQSNLVGITSKETRSNLGSFSIQQHRHILLQIESHVSQV